MMGKNSATAGVQRSAGLRSQAEMEVACGKVDLDPRRKKASSAGVIGAAEWDARLARYAWAKVRF